MGRRLGNAVVAAVTAVLLCGATAQAADPGRWQLMRVAPFPLEYYQGITDVPGGGFAFSGFLGVWRTDAALRRVAANPNVMPQVVRDLEGYNHIGDLDYDAAEGGRLLLPHECYTPGGPNGGNTCGTGSIGVADPVTLAWRYHVKLDPAEIKKAMWAEATPDGSLWTQDGRDLLRYALADITAANAAPAGPAIRPNLRLAGVVPPSGITGATFMDGRLFVAGQSAEPGGRLFQVWSIDLATGARQLEIERRIAGESEGLATLDARDGRLHWQVMPLAPGTTPTYGPGHGALLTFAPAGSAQARRRPLPTVVPHRQRLDVALQKGIALGVECPLPCTVRIRVTSPGRRRVLAAGTVKRVIGDGTRVRLRIRRDARREVRRKRVLVVRATATDEHGRLTLVPPALRLRR